MKDSCAKPERFSWFSLIQLVSEVLQKLSQDEKRAPFVNEFPLHLHWRQSLEFAPEEVCLSQLFCHASVLNDDFQVIAELVFDQRHVSIIIASSFRFNIYFHSTSYGPGGCTWCCYKSSRRRSALI